MKELLQGKTILIVDDEPDIRELLVTHLEYFGCKVLEATNGAIAFEMIRRQPFDLVISDIRMPGGDGVSLLKNIQSIGIEKPAVILITGFADINADDALRLGASIVLSKPFSMKLFEKKISELFQSKVA